MKLWKKILIGVGVAVVVLVPAAIFTFNPYIFTKVDLNNPPQFIQADFVDLSKIYSISKFRSGEGHDFSSSGETCRSMKHYFTPQIDPTVQFDQQSVASGNFPKPNGIDDIDIFSPVDGTITDIQEEHTPIGKQVFIVPDSHPEFVIRLFHVYPVGGMKGGIGRFGGTKVKAGEKIGVLAKGQSTDISVQVGNGIASPYNLVSYFQVMPDNIFAAYQARGATSRDEFIITKDYRDAHPLQCNGEEFVRSQDFVEGEDDVKLSGYVDTQAQYRQMQEDRARNPKNYMQNNSSGNSNNSYNNSNGAYNSGNSTGY